MSTEDNKLVVQKLYEAINAGNIQALDELVATDFINNETHGPSQRGLEPLKQGLINVRAAMPDIHFTLDDMIASGDRVGARGSLRGTHQGVLFGFPPTGNTIDITWSAIYRFEGGKIAERWLNGDDLRFMQQLGVVPANP